MSYIQFKEPKNINEILAYLSEQNLEDILRSFKLYVRVIEDEYKDKNFSGGSIVKKRELRLFTILETIDSPGFELKSKLNNQKHLK